MSDVTPLRLREELQKLAGQKAPLETLPPETACRLLGPDGAGLGYTQLNELLLLMGFDRVSRTFFQYLVDGDTEYQSSSTIASFDQLKVGVTRFRETGLLLFGNVKFAFKELSSGADELRLAQYISFRSPKSDEAFRRRHDPLLPIERIPADKTYLLGYLIERQLKERVEQNPNDTGAADEDSERLRVVETGRRNYEAYLASDHLDVYVATSMRERHEFSAISRLTQQIFGHPGLADLRLRWFDPTQAYCRNRMDKGLAEALMLKRAQCTIYLAQEGDTLGKDSELASTLAQDKPVIAFVPEVGDDFAERLLSDLRESYPGTSDADLLLDQLRLFDPEAAWGDDSVRRWVDNPPMMDVDAAVKRLQRAIASRYDRRADTRSTVNAGRKGEHWPVEKVNTGALS